MQLGIYVVKDIKTNSYGTPFFVNHVVLAQRSFITLCNDGISMYNGFPQDYELWHIGNFDQTDASIEPLKTCVLTGLDAKVGDPSNVKTS